MSSIYRKGRDGYFYYQAYVYNKATGKKDKKIFHSLGTKNQIEAESKKIKYDRKYNSKKNTLNFKIKEILVNQKLKIFLLLMLLGIIYLVNNFILESKKSDPLVLEIRAKNSSEITKNQNSEQVLPVEKDIFQKPDEISKEKVTKEPFSPKFSIERVVQLSSQFEQVQIFVTVEENFKKESLLDLCKIIKNDYNKFANIIICIYSNNTLGIQLANGYEQNMTSTNGRSAWLALYTYNAVEGEFFDDRPSGYLGGD